ncbi:hypothetical protein CYMTET_20591, partial [Cymbomonas tetramitiformis]
LYYAVMLGCIPVIVQPDVAQPFHANLPYGDFSVSIAQHAMYSMPELLAGIAADNAKLAAMQRSLACVQKYFHWEFNLVRDGQAGWMLLQILSDRLWPGKPPTVVCKAPVVASQMLL